MLHDLIGSVIMQILSIYKDTEQRRGRLTMAFTDTKSLQVTLFCDQDIKDLYLLGITFHVNHITGDCGYYKDGSRDDVGCGLKHNSTVLLEFVIQNNS